MQPILFVDRDGVILKEPIDDFQVDSIEKTDFISYAISNLAKIATEFNFYKVLISNQDGMGTASFPKEHFLPSQQMMLRALQSEGFVFDEIHIDTSFSQDNKDTRKPNTGMIRHLLNNSQFDIAHSYVIGDRWSDIQLAKNIGCKAIYLISSLHPLTDEQRKQLQDTIIYETHSWQDIYMFIKLGLRKASIHRKTAETDILVELLLDGNGYCNVHTGLNFFDHQLSQLPKHGKMDMTILAKGDLHVDEHHTIEDVAITLGEAISQALKDKKGIERYGFALPMDEAMATVVIDFGGRMAFDWKVTFTRERIGDVPTEMFAHFFKSFSESATCNLHIHCVGENEHHKIEAIFKAFAKAIKMAVKRDASYLVLPSTKNKI